MSLVFTFIVLGFFCFVLWSRLSFFFLDFRCFFRLFRFVHFFVFRFSFFVFRFSFFVFSLSGCRFRVFNFQKKKDKKKTDSILGDYLCAVCTNPQHLVDSIAARLLLDLDDVVTVEKADGIPDSEGMGAE
jgi:hypothetical protein